MKTPPLRLGQLDTLPMARGRGTDSTTSPNVLPGVVPQAAPQIIYLQAPPMPGPHSFGGHRMQRDIYVLPSSEPEEMEDPWIFSLVSKWLEDLQNSMAEDGHNFTLYSENFKAVKYMWISIGRIGDTGHWETLFWHPWRHSSDDCQSGQEAGQADLRLWRKGMPGTQMPLCLVQSRRNTHRGHL